MLDDLKQSAQSYIQERFSTPFAGAFLASWVVANWKLLYVLFISEEKLTIHDRISFVEKYYLNHLQNYIIPMGAAFLYVLVYPFVSQLLQRVWLWHKERIETMRNEVEKKTLLTVEQSLELRQVMKNLKQRYEADLQDRENTIAELRKENNSLMSKIRFNESTTYTMTDFDRKLGADNEPIIKQLYDKFGTVRLVKYLTGLFEGKPRRDLEKEDLELSRFLVKHGFFILDRGGKHAYKELGVKLREAYLLKDVISTDPDELWKP